MDKERLIFVTNDDGFSSKGFAAAVELARGFGHVIAVAPEKMQSGMSHAITIYNPLFARKVREEDGVEVYSLSGTPVDCVKFAFDYLLSGRHVDLVISGINHGTNSAVSVLYSGTMGAAMEASFYNVPAIGLSITDHSEDADFDAAVEFGRQIVGSVLGSDSLPESLCLNVNVPSIPRERILGMRVCRQTQGYWRERFFRNEDPNGREYFWMTGRFENQEPDASESDEWALANGYVAIVPVQVDMTAYGHMRRLGEILDIF